MIHAVIFDMDGTLIDTEQYHISCWRQASEDNGFPMSLETGLRMRSLAAEYAVPMLKELYGEEYDFEKVRNRKRKLMDEMLTNHPIEKKEGAGELLCWLKENGYKCAVATASNPVNTKKWLKELKLRDYFDYVVSAQQVPHGKPMPDIYLEVCKVIGEEPENCIAIEDSPNGALSAIRAGCKTIMIPDLTPVPKELKSGLFGEADNLKEVIGFLEEQTE